MLNKNITTAGQSADRSKAGGFTLVELLVVISIIGILAALLVANLVGTRGRATDTQKKADLRSLKTALQLYHNDYGVFPGSAFGLYIQGCGVGADANCVPPVPFAGGANSTVYMNKLPIGFQYKSGNLNGSCEPNRQTFLLSMVLENASDEDIAASQTRCNPTSRCYYTSTPAAVDYFVCED